MPVPDVDTMTEALLDSGELPGGATRQVVRDGLSRLIALGAAPVEIDARAVLFGRESVDDVAWLVIVGSLDEWGPDIRLSIRRPFHLCGEFSVATGPDTPFTTTVHARVPCTLLRIPGPALRALLTSSHPFALVLVAQMALHARRWSVTTYNQVSNYLQEVFQGALGRIAPAPYSLDGAVMYAFWVKLPTLPAQVSCGCRGTRRSACR